MIGIFIGIYVLFALPVWRMLSGHFAWSFMWSHQTVPDGSDWFGGTLCGGIAAAVWPVVAVWWMMSKHVPKIGAEREGELQKARKRIRQLEREAGL
jgi:hypothetical protein